MECKFYRPCVWYPASRLLQISHKSEKWQWHHSLPTRRHRQFFYVAVLLLSSLVIDPSFMSILLLVLEIWQFSFIRDWPEIGKSEIHPSEFFPILCDWGELGIPNLAQIFLINVTECCKIPQLQLLSFLRYYGKTNMGGKISPHPG